jgi:hypothetical protein
VEIYGYLSEQESRRIAGASPRLYYATGPAETVAPTFPVLLGKQRSFFYEVLLSVEDRAVLNRLRHETAFSANRLLVADSEHLGEMDSIKKAIARLFSLVNVGLLFLSEGDKDSARRLLADLSLREVFQIGFSRLADLRTVAAELARVYWPQWRAGGFGFLEHDQAEMMKGLMMRVPQRYGAEAGAAGFRDFATLDEVRATRHSLEEVAAAARAGFDKLGIPRPHEAKLALGEVFALGPEDITLGSLVLTGFVNLVLKGRFDVAPLAREDVVGLLDKVMYAGGGEEGRAAGRRVRPEALDELLIYLAGRTGFEGREMEALSRFVRGRVAELEAEIGGVSAAQDLDPRYVRTLLFKR